MTTDRQTEQAKRYQDQYRYYMRESLCAIERFILSDLSFESDLKLSEQYARYARELKIESDKLLGIPKMKEIIREIQKEEPKE